MKKISVLILISLLLISCDQKIENVSYNAIETIDRLNDELKEDKTDEDLYVDLFNAYVINNEYFEAIRVIDKALDNTDGQKTKELIEDLRDGYDVLDTNGAFCKHIMIDYDIDQTDQTYQRNVDFYQGKTDKVSIDRIGTDVDDDLSFNDEKLYKKSNYTIYLLEDDMIVDIFHYTYDTSSRDFADLKENHYSVRYDGDDVYYVSDDGLTDHYQNGKLIEEIYDNGDQSYNIIYEYDDNGHIQSYTKTNTSGVTKVTVTRHENGIPESVEEYNDFVADPEFDTEARTSKTISEYDDEGKIIAKTDYFNDEISAILNFEYDNEGRLYKETFINPDPSPFAFGSYERVYTYDDNGYLIRSDDLLDPDHYTKYEYNDDHTMVTVYTLYLGNEDPDASKVTDTQEYELHH